MKNVDSRDGQGVTSLKYRTYRALHGELSGGLTLTQRALFVTIIVAALLGIVGTEPDLAPDTDRFIENAELVIGALFLIEYVARIWSIGVVPQFVGVAGRARYIVQPMLLIDLIALLPFLLGAVGAEALVLRTIRALRLLALSKMLRYSEAMGIVIASVFDRRFELMFAVTMAGLLIVFSSAAIYLIEGRHQPEAFGSIARAMWWSVTTLTTVGYGDVVPATALGKFFAALTAFAGVGMIAMPTGILAASFSDAFAKARARKHNGADAGRLKGH